MRITKFVLRLVSSNIPRVDTDARWTLEAGSAMTIASGMQDLLCGSDADRNRTQGPPKIEVVSTVLSVEVVFAIDKFEV